ncbi:DddA-like double-stranded DNA deaminase toxin [Amycolatopsis sp. NPDC059021]|uniref:DddA-like double-stranded DNA deaminase toxin n=1 Tax=Amycolatopsis sp. NPDC059021 TaxID=3346704 RepID=UPI0036717ED7
MGVSELAAAVRVILGVLPTNLDIAARHLTESYETLAILAAGSAARELEDAVHALSEARQDIDAVSELIGRVRHNLETYLRHLGVDKPISTPRATLAEQQPIPVTPTDAPGARIADYRKRLEQPWPYGKPLRGWRLSSAGEEGDEELSSGTKLKSGETDPRYVAAVKRAEGLGLARGGFVPDIARHIEVKEASDMREGETRVVVLGKDPCGIDPVTNVSCHRFLRHFLPANATLIVYGPTGEPYRYEGKRTP